MALFKKILGLILLFLGLAIISYTLYSSFTIFMGDGSAPNLFTFEAEEALPGGGAQGIEGQMQQMIQERVAGALPFEEIGQLFNLIAWSVFAFILIFGGAQISGLGIKLLK